LNDAPAVRSFLTDVLLLETLGMKPVVIHGGGQEITQVMAEAGIEPRWVQGQRYTDRATLEIATRVLAGDICNRLVDEIRELGGDAVGLSVLSGKNFLIGQPLLLNGCDGEDVNLGFVGEVVAINHEFLDAAASAGQIPIIPCVAVDRTGQRLNVYADTAAAAVARLLKAEKLVFVSDAPGLLKNPDDRGSLISTITSSECRDMIANDAVAAGIVAKAEAALHALESGVRKLHIIDGRMPHSLLLEIYLDKGVGTEIVP